MDPGYLESLHRPNVTLTFDEIDRFVPQGVQLKTGDIVALDVLILGTGFSLVRLCIALCSSSENRHADSFCGYVTAAPSPGDLWRRGSSARRLLEIEGWARSLLWDRGAELSQLLYVSRYVCITSGDSHGTDSAQTVWGSGPNTAGGHASVVFNEEVQVCVCHWGQTLGFRRGAVPESVRVRSSTRCS